MQLTSAIADTPSVVLVITKRRTLEFSMRAASMGSNRPEQALAAGLKKESPCFKSIGMAMSSRQVSLFPKDPPRYTSRSPVLLIGLSGRRGNAQPETRKNWFLSQQYMEKIYTFLNFV